MPDFKVTRAHLKQACDSGDWALLDRLLEISRAHINDASLYTDGWGEWWGLLLECVYRNQADGVRVLLKHGAKRKVKSWGDCIPVTPLEAAADKPAILALLRAKGRPHYARKSDPPLPEGETAADRAINRQGAVRDRCGLVFPAEGFDDDDNGA